MDYKKKKNTDRRTIWCASETMGLYTTHGQEEELNDTTPGQVIVNNADA